MRAMQQPVRMQQFKIFADGDLRSIEIFGDFTDQHAAFPVDQVEDGAAAFFVQQGSSMRRQAWRPPVQRFHLLFPFITISFVCPATIVG